MKKGEKAKVTLCGGETVDLDIQGCCADHSNTNVLERPDLAPTANKKVRFCTHCGRQWMQCIKYVGVSLEVSHDWVPMPFPWEEPPKPKAEEIKNGFFF